MEYILIFALVLIFVLFALTKNTVKLNDGRSSRENLKSEKAKKRNRNKEKSRKTIESIEDLLDETTSFVEEIKEAKLDNEKKLKQQEYRFKTIFDNSPVGIARFTPSGVCLDANKSFARILGFHLVGNRCMSSSAISRNYNRFFTENNLHPFKTMLDEFIESGESEISSIIHVPTNGTVEVDCVLSVMITAFKDDESEEPNQILFYDVIVEDVTSQKNAENLLKKSNEILDHLVKEKTRELAESRDMYRSLYSSANVGLFRCTLNGDFLQANEYMSRLLKIDCCGDLESKNFFDFFTKESLDSRRRGILDNDSKVHTYDANIKINTMDYTVNVSEVINFAGEFFDGVLLDVTKTKKLECELKLANQDLERKVLERTENLETALASIQQSHAELQDAHGRLNAIITSIPEGVLLMRNDGTVVEVYPSWEYKSYVALEGKNLFSFLGEKYKSVSNHLVDSDKDGRLVFVANDDESRISRQIAITPINSMRDYYLVIIKDVTREIMVEKFFRRIIDSITKIMKTEDPTEELKNCLGEIGMSLNVDRVYIFKNHFDGEKVFFSQKYEWILNEGVTKQISNEDLQMVDYDDVDSDGFKDCLFNNIPWIIKDVSLLKNPRAKEILQDQQIKSIMITPIFKEGHFYGYVGMDDCKTIRNWGSEECSILGMVADCFGVVLN